jgi:predicted metal-dependent hydrolase
MRGRCGSTPGDAFELRRRSRRRTFVVRADLGKCEAESARRRSKERMEEINESGEGWLREVQRQRGAVFFRLCPIMTST